MGVQGGQRALEWARVSRLRFRSWCFDGDILRLSRAGLPPGSTCLADPSPSGEELGLDIWSKIPREMERRGRLWRPLREAADTGISAV